MNNHSSDNRRACPFCAEAIPQRARVCPRCRQWLTIWSFRHPVTNSLVVGVPVLLLMGVLLNTLLQRFDATMNPRPFYADAPDSLRVVESRMLWVETTNGPRIYVVGMLTNQSLVAWKDVEFQCRFFNTNGAMVDAAYPRAWLTILPHDEAAFRGVVTPGCERGDYYQMSTTVSSARNARSVF